MVIDTPGIDDEGELGALRVKKSYQVLNKTDIAVLAVDGTIGKQTVKETLSALPGKTFPGVPPYNKSDLLPSADFSLSSNEILGSAVKKTNIYELKRKGSPP